MTTQAGAASGVAGLNPFRLAWQLLTNVKFALLLVGLALLLSMVGVLIPQLPEEMRGNTAAESAWVELQRDTFGVFTDPMYRLDLFTVFRSWWFNGLWLLIIVAVTVCTVSRFRPTARSVRRPQREVPDSYFERAHHRADFTHPGGIEAVESLLRKRRYRVERVRDDDGATYLFAQRFAWGQYGTFLSHLALLMLLVGGFLTVFAGYQRVVPLAEGRPAAPVFVDPGPGQIFVGMLSAHRGIDDAGNIVDFRSTVEIRHGEELVTCEITINSPCSAFGHTFYQATYFDDLARLRIEGPDGRLLYDDVFDFNASVAPAPFVILRDETGRVLFEQSLPQLGVEQAPDGRTIALSQVSVQDLDEGRFETFPVGWRTIGGEMELFVLGLSAQPLLLAEGQSRALPNGYEMEFRQVVAIPSLPVFDMPGALSEQGAYVQLVGWLDGMPIDAWPLAETLLVIDGVDTTPLVLAPGEARTTSAGYRFEFGGQVAGAGIDVRRDPGHTFIWVAVAMALVGLSITFYVPRRRLWARISGDRTQLAGVAERTTRFGRELRMMGSELGSRDALLPTDVEERY
jgi:cytochrome c biogenesis protein